MKRSIIVIASLLVVVLLGGLIFTVSKAEAAKKTKFSEDDYTLVKTINEESKLAISLLQKMYDMEDDGITIEHPYVGTIDEYGNIFYAVPFPDLEEEICVNEIVVSSGYYDVLGMTVGTKLEEAEKILADNGFVLDYSYTGQGENAGLTKYCYKCGSVVITIGSDNQESLQNVVVSITPGGLKGDVRF